MKEIQNKIGKYLGVGGANLDVLMSQFKALQLEKGDYLLKAGQYQASLNFLKSGYVRICNVDANTGKEITQWIVSPGDVVTDIQSLFFGKSIRWDMQALTTCELLSISATDYNSLRNHISNWDQIEKLLLAKCFSILEERVYSHLAMSSEERYEFLFKQNPALFNNVPLLYIASMLGMSPETFSRIRRKLNS